MARPGFQSQLDTLVERDLAIHLGSSSTFLMLLAQPPLIGYLIGLAWQGSDPGPATFFIMVVASLWMGCLNASVAIVSERAVFDRERMVGLDVRAYLWAKLLVLSAIAAVQVLIMLYVQSRLMTLPGDLLRHLLTFLILWLVGVTASGLGLLISAVAPSVQAAVVAVPIFLIPQILFSELLLGSNIHDRIPAILEKFTLTKWGYQALMTIRNELDFGILLGSVAALAAGLALLLGAAVFKLKMDAP